MVDDTHVYVLAPQALLSVPFAMHHSEQSIVLNCRLLLPSQYPMFLSSQYSIAYRVTLMLSH